MSHRMKPRRPIWTEVTLIVGRESYGAHLLDVSEGGALLVLQDMNIRPVEGFALLKVGDLPGFPADIRWTLGNRLGIRFRAPLHPSVQAEAAFAKIPQGADTVQGPVSDDHGDQLARFNHSISVRRPDQSEARFVYA